MKESRYNHYFRRNGKDYAFNAMTCALSEVDESFFEAMRQVREGSPVADNKLVENMRYGGYIIPDLFDERIALKLRSQANKFSSRGLGLTIAPTLACNFACPYCYENAVPGVMSQEVQDAVVALVERRATRGDEIQVTWYGGEPLIALPVVEALSARMVEVCDTANVAYSAYMVSNGYLVTSSVIEVLKRCRVSAMQITIDGPRAIHDSRRKLKADGSGSFDTIVENVKLLLSCGIRPDIRINVDKTNHDRIGELLSFLSGQGLAACNVSFGHVNAYTEACADIEGTCLNTPEYAAETIEYQRILRRYGFSCGGYPYYPGIKGNYCCADSASAFVVGPDGSMYKCWNDIGAAKRSVGSVLAPEAVTPDQIMVAASYQLWSPFDHEKCCECGLLPMCMGGCPYNGMRCGGEPECEKWKYNLEETIILVLEGEERG